MNKLTLTALCCCTFAAAFAQDPRERAYNYEALNPSHVFKPKVELGTPSRIEEKLSRALVAVPKEDGSIYLSWRSLKGDAPGTVFDVYRLENGKKTKLNKSDVSKTTDFTDMTALKGKTYEYFVTAKAKKQKPVSSDPVSVTSGDSKSYFRVKLKDDVLPSKVAVCDLNGDGKWDFVVMHPNRGIDPGGQADTTGLTYKLDAYLNDGTFLWRYDLGMGIEPGVWYAPFIVYDFDGDGKAEVALKSGENKPREGKGSKYGWMGFDNWEKRDAYGRAIDHKEYLSVLDGMTGKETARVDWIPRSPRLGDYNRNNRNQMGMAFLDGKTPCILSMRGTYRAMFVDAWQYKDGKLISVWKWDGDEENPAIRSQGAHQSQSADVDSDGLDEIILGSAVLDDNGVLLWSAGIGHPDKAIVTDILPDRPGMEILYGCEVWHEKRGVCMVDAKTGEQIWNIDQKTMHVGDAMVADIDPSNPGLECWASEDKKGGQPLRYMLNSDGKMIVTGEEVPGCRNWVWWDGDLIRETFKGDGYNSERGAALSIVNYKNEDKPLKTGIEGSISVLGDLLGDWREEVLTIQPGEIRIYSTDIPAKDKRETLLQDSKYRIDIVNRTQGYPQSPVPTYYMGE